MSRRCKENTKNTAKGTNQLDFSYMREKLNIIDTRQMQKKNKKIKQAQYATAKVGQQHRKWKYYYKNKPKITRTETCIDIY